MLSENMASLGGENLLIAKDNLDESNTIQEHHQHQQNDIPPIPIKRVKDRDERLRQIKDRQNEERQKKLEELKAQAFAAQKYREQKEEERRRRIDELRSKENDKRQQVEDRKKAILDAEKDRREYIVRKNLERDSRLETKRRNERSSIGFAFGSSTPRLLDPVDIGALSSGNFWGHRRSTSITNVAYNGGGAQISRRSSERELSDAPKKRAISAGGLDRQNEDDITTDSSSPIIYRSVARRKTDLMPTIPSPREPSFGSRASLYCSTPRTPGSRSGEVTPGGSVISRPGSALSSANSTASGVIRRAHPLVRRPRPASIAGTGMSSSIAITGVSNDAMHEINKQIQQHKKDRPPIPIPRAQNIHRKTLSTTNVNQNNGSLVTSKTMMTTSTITVSSVTSNSDSNLPPKRPERRSQTQTIKKKITSPLQPPKTDTNKLIKDIINTNEKIETTIKNDVVLPIIVNENNNNNNNINDSNSNNNNNSINETKTPNVEILKIDNLNQQQQQQQEINENSLIENIESGKSTAATAWHPLDDNTNETISNNINQEFINNEKNLTNTTQQQNVTTITNVINDVNEHELESLNSNISEVVVNNSVVNNGIIATAAVAASAVAVVDSNNKEKTLDVHETVDMSASMMAKRITTEEEAKAALAERRRLAREEAERQAELERQRVEAEEIAEQQRIVEEEERQRRFEEETLRLAEEQRISEEQRLLQAIEEAKQREEEERQRREEDERLRLEREESDRKTREDLEKQKIEVAERLKKEEEERNERRKRVEAIMKRTRTTGSAGTPGNNTSMATPNKNDDKDSPVEKDIEQPLIINDNNNTVNIDNIDNKINDNINNNINKNNDDNINNNNNDTNDTNNDLDNNNNNNNNNNQSSITQVTIVEATNQKDAFNEYEKSVMDKEISLMSQFSNLIEKNNFQNSDNNNNNNNNQFKSTKINGNIEVDLSKAIDEKLIINNNNNNNNTHHHHHSAISNGNGHTTDNSLDNNKIESTTTIITTTTTTDVIPSNIINNNNNNNVIVTDHIADSTAAGQLIDFNLDSTNETININNNNGLQQIIPASLVTTSDSQDNRDISLL